VNFKDIFINGVCSGLKKRKNDLGIIYFPYGFFVLVSFTKNKFKAAPILISKKNLSRPKVLVANSKFANAGTGKEGFRRALEVTKFCSEIFKVKRNEVLLASTGVIGKQLPISKVKDGLKKLGKLLEQKKVSPLSFAKSILTTDTCTKIVKTKNFWACAKGSGMISPNLATFLCFIISDAFVDFKKEKRIFKDAIEVFNHMSVDGETSTNDSVFFLSTALKRIKEKDFKKQIDFICSQLSRKIIEDGEGATKVIKIVVKGARTKNEAQSLARFLSNSPLIKTAFNGESPNWGRIYSRVGFSGVNADEKKLKIKICQTKVFDGKPVFFDRNGLRKKMQKKFVSFEVDLRQGRKNFEIWTNDLSKEYVKINAEYN